VGLYARAQEALARSIHHSIANRRCFDYLIGIFGGRSIYLHTILTIICHNRAAQRNYCVLRKSGGLDGTMAEVDLDVAVLGGGPGGSAAASYLAKAGLKCVVFERELFPRPHVGESLVPASNRALNDLGLVKEMDELKFPRKFGAVWTSASYAPVYNVDWEGLGDGVKSVGTAETSADIRFDERAQEASTSTIPGTLIAVCSIICSCKMPPRWARPCMRECEFKVWTSPIPLCLKYGFRWVGKRLTSAPGW
jgi:Tryptophan halogenase